jgi:hypothetical protein
MYRALHTTGARYGSTATNYDVCDIRVHCVAIDRTFTRFSREMLCVFIVGAVKGYFVM